MLHPLPLHTARAWGRQAMSGGIATHPGCAVTLIPMCLESRRHSLCLSQPLPCPAVPTLPMHDVTCVQGGSCQEPLSGCADTLKQIYVFAQAAMSAVCYITGKY